MRILKIRDFLPGVHWVWWRVTRDHKLFFSRWGFEMARAHPNLTIEEFKKITYLMFNETTQGRKYILTRFAHKLSKRKMKRSVK